MSDEAADTLTGPVVRGEAATVASHVDALRARAPELLETYRLVTETIVLAAVEVGRLWSGRPARHATWW